MEIILNYPIVVNVFINNLNISYHIVLKVKNRIDFLFIIILKYVRCYYNNCQEI